MTCPLGVFLSAALDLFLSPGCSRNVLKSRLGSVSKARDYRSYDCYFLLRPGSHFLREHSSSSSLVHLLLILFLHGILSARIYHLFLAVLIIIHILNIVKPPLTFIAMWSGFMGLINFLSFELVSACSKC